MGLIFVLWMLEGDWIVGGKIGVFIWGGCCVSGVEEFGGNDGGRIPFAAEWDIGGKIWKKKRVGHIFNKL
jgi:hypothetical protein